MKTKHTQGEWELLKERKINAFRVAAINDKRNKAGKRLLIASVHFEKSWKDPFISNVGIAESEVRRTELEAEANAKLIATAPEMLNELISVLPHLERYSSLIPDSIGWDGKAQSLDDQFTRIRKIIKRLTDEG